MPGFVKNFVCWLMKWISFGFVVSDYEKTLFLKPDNGTR